METQVEHGQGFGAVWRSLRNSPPTAVLDLGSGGGIPGLVLLAAFGWPVVMVDASQERVESLQDALALPSAPPGGAAVWGRAEELARQAEFEGRFDLVVSRLFGPPAVAAECGVRFLRPRGLLIVSDPPQGDAEVRWPPAALATLGLRRLETPPEGFHFTALELEGPVPDRFPRRNGRPAKRPLW